MSETKTMSSTKTTSTEQVRFLTVTAIGIALVYVFTWLINIRLPFAPQGGLIHLGHVPLFIFAILFGKKTGAIAGGVGMGLFDLLSGTPLTFFLKYSIKTFRFLPLPSSLKERSRIRRYMLARNRSESFQSPKALARLCLTSNAYK